MSYLTAFVELFRFIKRYRERVETRLAREADERAAERAHQRAMLETIFGKMVESQKVQSESILALADAQRSNADVMKTWLDGFKIADPAPMRPVVAKTDEEEWVKEQLELAKLGLADIDVADLPPEFQLAYQLAHSEDDSGEES
jgi:hypothetical protein